MPTLHELVDAAVRKIPKGRVTTYKEIGRHLNFNGYRAIGNAIAKQWSSKLVPTYKVVRSDGTLAGDTEIVRAKIRRLRKENIFVCNGRIVDFEDKLFRF